MDNSAIMNDIRPLKAPVEITGGFPLVAFLILVLAFTAAIAVFIYFKRRKQAVTATENPLKSPEEIAMEELQALREKNLAGKGMIKEYYIEISDIIRKYIEGKFRVSALDRTTWEIYQEMRDKKIQRQSTARIKDFLEGCDMVKFAKYIPDQKEIEDAYNKAKEIIEITVEKMTNDKAQNSK